MSVPQVVTRRLLQRGQRAPRNADMFESGLAPFSDTADDYSTVKESPRERGTRMDIVLNITRAVKINFQSRAFVWHRAKSIRLFPQANCYQLAGRSSKNFQRTRDLYLLL